MKLDNETRCLIDNRKLDFIGALEDQMQICLNGCVVRKEKDIQNKVYALLSSGFEPYQVIAILSLINNL